MGNERIKQHKFTGVINPEVRLLSVTENPVGTLFSMWHGSRNSKTVDAKLVQSLYDLTADQEVTSELLKLSKYLMESYPEYSEGGNRKLIESVVKDIIRANVPVSESVLFSFEIDNASVAWREQLVRSPHAKYWTQTSRTADMTSMDINMSRSIELIGGKKAVDIYSSTCEAIRTAYEQLIDLGVPPEDIRLQPQMHTHRVYWMITLRSLIFILNKRGDWIAQASLWTPIIGQVVSILRDKGLYDIVKDFIGKPMCEVGDQNGTKVVTNYQLVNEGYDRYMGRDLTPVDPLFLAYKKVCMPEHTNLEFYDYMKSLYIHIWSDEYLEVLGWDRNDPHKVGPYDRPHSYFETNGMLDMVKGLRVEL